MKKIFLTALLFLFVFSLIPVQAQAVGLVPCGGYELDENSNLITQSLQHPVPQGWIKINENEMAKLEPACNFCHFFVLINRIVQFIMTRIVTGIAVLMLTIGGIMFIFAFFGGAEILPGGAKGGPKTLNQAKRIITSTIIGLVIIFAAFLIVGTILSAIGLAGWTEEFYKNWWSEGFFRIPCD